MDKKNFSYTTPRLVRGKLWFFELYAVHISGVKKRIKLKAGLNKIQSVCEREAFANRWLHEFDPEKFFGVTDVPRVSSMLPEVFRDYLEHYRNSWKQRSLNTYRYQLSAFYEWCSIVGLEFDVKTFTSKAANAFLRYLLNEKHVSPTTFNAYRATLYTFFKRMKVRNNPFQDCLRLHACKTPQLYFTESQRNQLLEYLKLHDHDLYLFCCMMFYLFLRPNELRHARVCDIDFENSVFTVGSRISKTNRVRYHVIPWVFLDDIKHLESCSGHYFIFGFDGCPGIKQCGKSRFGSRMRTVLRRLGFGSRYSLYSWRHAGAIELYKQCGDVRMVQNAMQHTSIVTTESYLRQFGVLQDARLRDRNPISGMAMPVRSSY